ncbi:TPA: cystatin-like fold lipoprotein [Staphylococcus aureus]|uniref:cystatin-like fold lipoprotein n=1 Tax=Staphylococcus aureus TaxID=1280 RepID=UPI0013036A1E|nr:cystatin-like fold lipoprotein [Staphylococcus aureus]HAR2858376.1 cystatin-like fold lipoprotein [Staphylococcus aureus]HAR2942589.1 cystatin-like fold lipoprotein [Staphylococcus aureus]
MKKRFLISAFILILSIALVACGKEYDKEIEEVSKLEKEETEHAQSPETLKFERDKSNIHVYDDGKLITLSYKATKNGVGLSTSLYRKNETTDNYEKDYNAKLQKFMKENKPDYKEENLKE